jgi:uncharacterized protein
VVNETVYGASLIVQPDRIIADWPPQSFAHLAEPHFRVLAGLGVEVVLIGTGAKLRFPPSALLRPLIAAGCGFEIMDTGAACRTYNILMGEGRRVAAALLMIESESGSDHSFR